MALQVSRVDIWAGSVQDRPGALAEKLTALAEAGAELQYVMARRAPEKPGTGVVFLAPLKGARQTQAAKRAGLHKSRSIFAVRAEGADKPGLGAQITAALGAKDINLRGMSAAVIGKRFVLYLALDGSTDATKAARVLRQMC
jgi:hypothetical protein